MEMAQASRQQLLTSVKSLLTSGDYSDLVITCSSDTYNVHKAVVCSRAGFFARAVKFGGQEAHNGKIDLPEDDPAIVKLLLQFIYNAEYDPVLPAEDASRKHNQIDRPRYTPSSYIYQYDFPHICMHAVDSLSSNFICPHHTCTPGTCGLACKNFNCDECNPTPAPALEGTADQLLIHAKMYEVADKYDVVGLKDLSKEKFSRSCAHFWNEPQFGIAANHAFSTTPDHDKGLRDIVSSTIADHMELVKKPEIEALLEHFNGLAFGLLKRKQADGCF